MNLIKPKHLVISVILGLFGFFLVYNEIYFVLPGTTPLTDMREIFVTIAAALLGPIGGGIVAIFTCLYDPNPELLPYIISQHIVSAVLLSFYYKKIVYEKLTMPLLIVGWVVGIFLYYFVFYLPVFIAVYLFNPSFFNQIVPNSNGLFDIMEVLYLYSGWIPEFLFTTVFTSLIIIALPEQYRKPLWGKEISSAKLKSKNFGIRFFEKLRFKNSLAVRLTIWFLLLAVFPILVISLSIKKDMTHTLLLNEASMRSGIVEDIKYVVDRFNDRQAIDVLRRIKKSVKGETFFVDTDGNYAFSLDSNKTGASILNDYPKNIVETIITQKNGKLIDSDNERSFAFGQVKIQNIDLIIVAISDSKKVKGLLTNLSTEINQKLLIGILIISLSLIGIMWMLIQSPLSDVQQTIDRITEGEFDVRVNTENLIDEIKSLGSALNTMANKITSSEKRFREMAELLPQTLFEVDTTGRLTYANPIAFELFGYSRKDFEGGINIIQLIHPDGHTRAIENINKIYKGALLGGSEYTAIKKDGTQFPILIYTTRQEENGNLIGLRGILLDISNIKQAEESIKASEEKFKSIVQGLTDMILIVNAEGKITFITPSVTRITDFTEDEMIGNSPLEFIHPDDVELAISELGQSEKSNYESTPTLYRLKNKNGFYIYVETIGIDMMSNKYVNGVVVFCRNVTERIKYERQLSESEAKLKESQRVAKIGHYDFDIVSGIWTSSDGLDELFGIDKSYQHNLSGWTDLLHPDDREKMNDYLSNYVVKEKNRFEKEFRIVRYSDKQVIWVYGLGNLEYNEMQIPVKMFGTIQNITDRKIAQNVLFNSEQRFKYIWENTLDAMRITDERGKILLVNDAYCKMVNKNREELEGSSFTVVFKEEERENFKIKYLENFRNKSLTGRNEYDIKFWNNKIIFADISIVVLKIPEQPTLLLTVLHDITDRKIAEDYLRESEEKFRQTFDYSAAGVMILNLDSNFQKVNTAFVKMIGYSENELKKMSCNDITFQDDLAESDLIYNSLLENKISNTSFEKRYITKDNKIIYCQVSISLVKDFSNKPLYFVLQVFDITEQKQAQESVRKLSQAVEQSPATIVITDIDGNIEYVNKKFTEITGYSQEEAIGANPRILKSGHTPSEGYSDLWRTISSGKEWRGEFHNNKKNGEFYWEEALISPIFNEFGKPINYLAVKEDITERKKLLADLIEAKQKAEEMNKIKSYFFANMSHELRTPFVGIMGFSELLSESLQNPDEKEMAHQILKSSKRLTDTLNKILNVTRIEFDNLEIKPKNFDVCRLINDIVILYSTSAQLKNTIISTVYYRESFIINTDPKVLEDVLNNLVSNAIKFTENGKISLSVDQLKEPNGQYIIIKVQDTGIGIPKEKQELVWHEFRQASEGFNRSFEGTGLGLTISKKYIRMLKGDIYLESEVGRGSTFTIKIPVTNIDNNILSEPKLKPVDEVEPIFKNKVLKSKPRILFVEDDAVALQYIKIILKSICDVDTAIDANNAVQFIEKNIYDILMLDINLGRGMDGVELMQKIRQRLEYKTTPIVAVTAYASESDKKEFLAKGFSHYISKPFTSIELKKLLNEIIG